MTRSSGDRGLTISGTAPRGRGTQHAAQAPGHTDCLGQNCTAAQRHTHTDTHTHTQTLNDCVDSSSSQRAETTTTHGPVLAALGTEREGRKEVVAWGRNFAVCTSWISRCVALRCLLLPVAVCCLLLPSAHSVA